MVGNTGMTSVLRHSSSHPNKVAVLSPYRLHLRWRSLLDSWGVGNGRNVWHQPLSPCCVSFS